MVDILKCKFTQYNLVNVKFWKEETEQEWSHMICILYVCIYLLDVWMPDISHFEPYVQCNKDAISISNNITCMANPMNMMLQMCT